jgi:hypothetical protein
MSIKSILRSAALLGVAVAALAIAPVAMAIDEGFAPRPDFPGAKQSQSHSGKAQKMPRSTSKSTSKVHAQHTRGKHHAS